VFTAVTELSTRLMSVIALLAICGFVVSSVSLHHHYATSKTPYCDFGQAFNCDLVNRSAYSTMLGVPVALIGMLGYAMIAGLATVYRRHPSTPTLLFVLPATGLAFALYLTYVEGHILGVWCILCLASFALIAMITILAGINKWKRDRVE